MSPLKSATTAGVEAYREHMDQIPPEKRASKKQRLLIGLVSLLVGALAVHEKWPITVPLVCAGSVGFCISPDYMKAIAKFAAASIKDIAGAMKGNGTGKPAGE